jgi:hypothetical protein
MLKSLARTDLKLGLMVVGYIALHALILAIRNISVSGAAS